MIVVIIPAKKESGRLPNKNLLKIDGITLIEYAVRCAKESKSIDEIYVSTDSDEISKHAIDIGVKVIRRGSELGGETPLIEVYRHAWRKINDPTIEFVVGIQPDNPDRSLDVDRALEYAISNNIDNLFSVDSEGKRNGAINILNLNALRADPFVYASTIKDDCTNIHSAYDLEIARFNIINQSTAVNVKERKIGNDQPVFIIAEAACNHMCDMSLAKQMIDEAIEAGADAIKFQTYKAESLVTKDAIAFWGGESISQLEYYKRLDRFGEDEYQELFNYAKEKGIIAFSSPFDRDSTEMLARFDTPLFKIASCDIPNIDHIRHIAGFGKPIIMSTGASTINEIDAAIQAVFEQGNYQLMLLACTLSYPTKFQDANLNRIKTLIAKYPNITIGLSDHTEPDPFMVIPSIAVALGAKIIEKHFTLDRTMTGSGHFFAVDPSDLKKMVQNIRLTESILGTGQLGIDDSEKKAWLSARRSIVACKKINAGEVIDSDMICLKRPGCGLPASNIRLVVGKKSTQKIAVDQMITLEMIE